MVSGRCPPAICSCPHMHTLPHACQRCVWWLSFCLCGCVCGCVCVCVCVCFSSWSLPCPIRLVPSFHAHATQHYTHHLSHPCFLLAAWVFSRTDVLRLLPMTRVTVLHHHMSPSPRRASALLVTPLRTRCVKSPSLHCFAATFVLHISQSPHTFDQFSLVCFFFSTKTLSLTHQLPSTCPLLCSFFGSLTHPLLLAPPPIPAAHIEPGEHCL